MDSFFVIVPSPAVMMYDFGPQDTNDLIPWWSDSKSSVSQSPKQSPSGVVYWLLSKAYMTESVSHIVIRGGCPGGSIFCISPSSFILPYDVTATAHGKYPLSNAGLTFLLVV